MLLCWPSFPVGAFRKKAQSSARYPRYAGPSCAKESPKIKSSKAKREKASILCPQPFERHESPTLANQNQNKERPIGLFSESSLQDLQTSQTAKEEEGLD
jgi:hypothetical protein